MSGIQSTCQNCGGEIVLRAEAQWYAPYEANGERHTCPVLALQAAGDEVLRLDIWKRAAEADSLDAAESESGAVGVGESEPEDRLLITKTRTADLTGASHERAGSREPAFMSQGVLQGIEGEHGKSTSPAVAGRKGDKHAR